MKIADLKDRTKVPQIDLLVKSKSEPRTVTSRLGESLTVADCEAVDEDGGSIKITLWNDEVGQVEAGERIRIVNGWVSAYRNQLQLSAGKFGKIEKLEGPA